MDESKTRENASENTVYVGRKKCSPTQYAMTVVDYKFNRGIKEVEICARGMAITNAVDTLERLKRVHPPTKVKSIETASNEVQKPDLKDPAKMITTRVSSIRITVTDG